MSVVRRNTFDIFDEEADLLSTREGKTAHNKRRRKKRPPSTNHRAAESPPIAGNGTHEVGHTMANHATWTRNNVFCQTF